MIGGIASEEKDFCWTPRNVESTVSFCTVLQFPNLPEEEGKAVSSAA
jgi:hypothetical protein